MEDITVLVKAEGKFNLETKVPFPEYIKDEANLLDLLKWNALFNIGKCLQLLNDPQYSHLSRWEKFN